jgi:RNA polymerase sigma factor (sigma-70 family)
VEEVPALVLFGDVVNSSRDRIGTTEWLRGLVDELDVAYEGRRLAQFDFTQGDEIQGLLKPDADPIEAVLRAALGPSARPVRWVAIRGPVDPGEGPATRRNGTAFIAARKAIEEARARHQRLVVVTGKPDVDALLADMTPVLADLLAALTARQREVTRLAVVEGLRQSGVAERLGIRRATVSVSFTRARVQSIEHLVSAIRTVYSTGVTDGPRAGAEPDGLER